MSGYAGKQFVQWLFLCRIDICPCSSRDDRCDCLPGDDGRCVICQTVMVAMDIDTGEDRQFGMIEH